MRIGSAAWAAVALLTLAGCGRDPESEGGDNNATAAPAIVQEPVNETLSDDPQNGVVPLEEPANASAPAAAATSFPATFQGRWGLVPNDCDPSRDDAKGLMVVEPTTLRFYESGAKLASAQASGTDTLAAQLSFSGEGQTWTAERVFTLRPGGKLHVDQKGEEKLSLDYAKCPAA